MKFYSYCQITYSTAKVGKTLSKVCMGNGDGSGGYMFIRRITEKYEWEKNTEA